jgi:multidrug efflux pump subunit AcrA (membrane-fusion protein)
MPRVFRQSAFWAALICVIALGVGGLVVLSQNKARDAADAETRSMVAARGPFVAIANGRADVDGGVVHVAARRPGIVREVFVEEGQQVVRGQVLAQQEDDEPRLAAASAAADLHQAKAQIAVSEVRLSAAQREYARLQSLSTSNIIAAQRLDQAADVIREAQAALQAQRAAVGSAEARLSEAKYNLDLTVIRAPMDGRIVRRFANPGEGASTLNVSTMFDLEPKGRPNFRKAPCPSSMWASRCRSPSNPTPRGPIRARWSGGRPCSAPASWSPTTRPSAPTNASSRSW